MVAAEGAKPEEVTEGALNRISGSIIGAAIEVHRTLGPGLLEAAYRECLVRELLAHGHRVERRRDVRVVYKGTATRRRFRLDMVVDGLVLVEIKTVEHLLPVHEAQVLSYLRLACLPLGLLINFHQSTLVAGLRRFRVSVPSSPSMSSTTKGE